jgi:ribosomal protein L11 methyltransferase
MAWLQISVEVPGDQAEMISEAFSTIGALSVTVLDAGDEPLLEPAPGETPLWLNTRIIALFDAAQDAAGLKQQLQSVLDIPVPDLFSEPLVDRDWSNTWRDTFGAMQFGERLWVCPVGESPQESAAIVVHMDPGMAFGTGTHATTGMCLHWLDRHPPLDQRVLDFGCGSGILAIAAHKLGAADVTAVDIDPQALLATEENARRNDCGSAIEVLHPDRLEFQAVDLLIANILANPLIELADDFSRRLMPGGRIILTGILEEQAEAVMAAYREAFDFCEPVHQQEWVLLEGMKRHTKL